MKSIQRSSFFSPLGMHRVLALASILLAGLATGGCGAAASQAGEGEELTIFAAASLRDVVGDLAAAFTAADGAEVTVNFAGSNTLAQQIRAAPAADLFFSADEDWVRFLEARGRAVPGSARPILGNRLVLIARADAPVAGRAWNDLGPLLSDDYENLVLADPGAVPAGRYSKAYLEHAGAELWRTVESRIVPTLDVRAALQLVATDPKFVGIVYRTDAQASDEVKILYELPAVESLPIVYWALRIQGGGANQAGRRFMDFLASEEASAIVEARGFQAAPTR